MNTGARLMVACWSAVSLAGCAAQTSQAGVDYDPPDPETGRRSVTVGVGAGGGGHAAQALDRTQVPAVGEPEPLELPGIQDYTLDNGMRVVLVERSALPLVSLESLTRDDVTAFHRARYAPGQATLVVAGDVTRAALDSLLAGAFAGWAGHGVDPEPLAGAAPREGRAIYVVDKPGAAQSEVRVGHVAVGRDTDAYYPLTVLNTVLGGSFTSRLNSKLREEKGYTYGAASFFDMRRAPGPFEAMAAVATQVTDSAVVDFVQEIGRMGSEAVPADELDRARNYLALRLPQRFESLDDVVRRLAELVTYDVPLEFWAGYVAGVEAVDEAAVMAAARRMLDTGRTAIVIAGDRAVIEEPLKALGLGPVVVLGSRPVSQE